MPMAKPAPMNMIHSAKEIPVTPRISPCDVKGTNGFVSQLRKPAIATMANAAMTRADRIVVMRPTSLTPRMLMYVKMRMMAALTANSS